MKKTNIKRLLFMLLSLVLVLSVASCGGDKDDGKNNGNDGNDQNAIETLSPDKALAIGDYVIVRSDTSKQEIKDATVALRQAIKEKTGVDIKIVTDMKGAVSKEIIVGASKRMSADGIMLDQFKIERNGDKISIIGGTDEQTAKGVEYFIANLLSEKGVLTADGYSYVPSTGFTVTSLKVGDKNIDNVVIASAIENTSFASNIFSLVNEKVGLPSEQAKKADNANIIVTNDLTLGVEDGNWALLTKDGKIYVIGSTYYEQKAAYDCLAAMIREAKGELTLKDGIIKTDKVQSKEDYYGQTQLVIYPELPEQIRRIYDYKVSVTQGDKTASIPVYNHTMEYPEFSRGIGGDYYRRFAMFAFSGERTRVDIKVGTDFSSYTVMPSAKNFETTFKDGVISVYLDKPDYFMIRLDDDDNSIISIAADYPEYPGDIPSKGDPGVYYIEGWYEPDNGLFEATEPGAQVYVAPGAVLNARCKVTGAYSRITGRGVVVDPFENINDRDIREGGTEGSGWKMMTITGEGSYFNGLTFLDARCFNLALSASNVEVYNYKAFSSMMTTDGLSLFSGKDHYVEHCLLYVADNTFVYSVEGSYVNDVLCGTTCATLFPQGNSKDVTFENLYVMRSSDGFLNNRYNPDKKERSHSATIINSDAVDCINLPHFFSGYNMGMLPKAFEIKNVSLPALTGVSNPHNPASLVNKNKLLSCWNSDSNLYTENYEIVLTNVYIDGKLVEQGSPVGDGEPYFYVTVRNDGEYTPVERIIHEADYRAKDTVYIGALQMHFANDIVKEGETYYLPADEILKQLRATGDKLKTKEIDGVAYISSDDLEDCSNVDYVEVTGNGVIITPIAPSDNILLPDEGEISYYSEAVSYTVDLVVKEEDGSKVYYMYDHGGYFTGGLTRSIVNDIKMYGANTYTISFKAKAPAEAEIETKVRYDTVQSTISVKEELVEIDKDWVDVSVSFEVTEEMLECEAFDFRINLTTNISELEWFAVKDIYLN